MQTLRCHRRGFSLLELLAVVSMLGVIAMLIIPRLSGPSDSAKSAACHGYQGEIEIQAEMWFQDTGSWPATNLADVGANTSYFPEGVPQCPVDGSPYTIDATGRVVGHSH